MYTIIGGDGREYGPVPAEQVRLWIAEGRSNADTAAKSEGTNEWKPLRQFPEFAQPAAPPRMPGASSVAGARKSKLAAGLLGILLGGWGVHRFYLGYIGIGILQIFVTLFTCGIGALWGLIEGILIIAGQSITTDAYGVPLQD